MRKYPIGQCFETDGGHFINGLKEGGTRRICKAVKDNGLHLSPFSVNLSEVRLYRLRWMVTDNQWCEYVVWASDKQLKTSYNKYQQAVKALILSAFHCIHPSPSSIGRTRFYLFFALFLNHICCTSTFFVKSLCGGSGWCIQGYTMIYDAIHLKRNEWQT